MKKYAWPCALSMLLLAACKQNTTGKEAAYVAPKPGTVIAADSMDAMNNKLNKFKYVVAVLADSNINYGVYTVVAQYGHDTANSQFTMPHGAEHDVPVLKRGKDAATFVIGFHHDGDTTFYEYYEVQFARMMGENATNSIAMKYLKGYSFQ